MKKVSVIILALILSLSLTACAYDSFGHETYTNVDDYGAAFELSEIRFDFVRNELFPKDVSSLDVERFYYEWELGIVGSADVETLLSVKYEEKAFLNEIARIKSLSDQKIMYDESRFSLPAYVAVLGDSNTSIYALVDADNFKIHYIHLQLIDEGRIDIPKDFLPEGYSDYGDVSGISFNAYDS